MNIGFRNRLQKNFKRFNKKFSKATIEAWRLYDKDMPEAPYQIDLFKDFAVVYEKGKSLESEDSRRQENHETILSFLQEQMGIEESKVFFKTRKSKPGGKAHIGHDQDPYSKEAPLEVIIKEGDTSFLIRPSSFFDPGLFLDHRPMRHKIRNSQGEAFLNLFSYTCSMSVCAAKAGMWTHSLDLSKTYLSWGEKNFEINNLSPHEHKFERADCLERIKTLPKEKYDIVFFDPPTFSNSSAMEQTLDIQRDHFNLLQQLRPCLKPTGVLYFSNNLRSFKIDSELEKTWQVKDISAWSLPEDYKDPKTHHCFEMVKR